MNIDTKTLNEMFKFLCQFAIEQDMLTPSVIEKGDFKFTTKSAKSFGGRKNNRAYMRLNYGSAVFSPQRAILDKALFSSIHKPSAKILKHLKFVNSILLTGKYGFKEYAHLNAHSGVGDFFHDEPTVIVGVLLAHEMSHVVNYNSHNPKWKGRNHKEQFRKVYRILRKAIVEKFG